MLCGIQANEINQYWPLAEPLIEKALARTGAIEEYGLEDIKELLISRDMQLWLWIEDEAILCTAITQVLCYPKRKVLDIPFVGAKTMTIGKWFTDGLGVLTEFAAAHDCTAIKGYGRFGWVRKLPGKVRSEACFYVEVDK